MRCDVQVQENVPERRTITWLSTPTCKQTDGMTETHMGGLLDNCSEQPATEINSSLRYFKGLNVIGFVYCIGLYEKPISEQWSITCHMGPQSIPATQQK